ncbi:MAG: DUF2851 family protein [Ignavibacteriaceae bacterium]
MEKTVKVHEKFLCEIWKKQNFTRELTTKDGQQVSVIDMGSENKELGGPDFKNVRIKIGNITYLGDVEIDSFHSDWKKHGHSLNKKYNKVILHVVMKNDSSIPYVFTQDGRKVQSISLENCLTKDLRTTLQEAIESGRDEHINKMPCKEINELVTEQEKLNYLYELGLNRFKKKSEKILERLKEIIYLNEYVVKEPVMKYDLDEKFYERKFTAQDFMKVEPWQQLFYELIFEALGYSKNKEIMLRLSQAVQINFLKTLPSDDFSTQMEAALFNIGGIIPEDKSNHSEEVTEYLKKLTLLWNNSKDKYDGKTFQLSQWHFFKLRPQNFPTIRLAGGVTLLRRMLKENMVANLLALFDSTMNLNKLTNELRNLIIVKGEGFWSKHYVFEQSASQEIKYFIGVSRADEILVNVILPIASVYFEVFNKKEAGEKVVKLFLNYLQKSENNLVCEVSSTLCLHNAWQRSVLYQGMIELFRNYCSREKCMECNIGKRVFS